MLVEFPSRLAWMGKDGLVMLDDAPREQLIEIIKELNEKKRQPAREPGYNLQNLLKQSK